MDQPEIPEKKVSNFSPNWALMGGASQLGVLVAVGLVGGLYLDRKLGTMPLLGFIGCIGGFVSGVIFLIRIVKASFKDK